MIHARYINNKKNGRVNKITIVPFGEEHLTEKYRSWFHDPVVTEFNSHGLFPYSRAAMKKFMENIENGGPDIIWAILSDDLVGEPVHIGNCSLQSISWINRSCELAFVIGDTDYHSTGVGEAVGKMMLKHAFKKLGLNRAWTGTAETNIGMRKVAERVGMKEEGRFRQGKMLEGQMVDIVCYSILKEEWKDEDE